MKLWACPHCDDRHRAPARMRNNNALKYCLKCSAKTGKLVLRVCPSLEQERQRKAEAARLEEQKRRERIAAKSAAYNQTEKGQLEQKCREYLRLDAFKGLLPKGLVMFDVRLSRPRRKVEKSLHRREEGMSIWYDEVAKTTTYPRPAQSSGRAYFHQDRFVVTAGSEKADAWATIIHEIAHLATPKDRGHGDQWRSVFAEAIFEVTGERPSGGNKYEFHESARDCVRRYIERGESRSTEPVLTRLLHVAASVVTVEDKEKDDEH